MTLQRQLTSLSPQAWQVHQAVVFDWYDGPRQGVARLSKPTCEFVFELLAERPTADDLDDRLFRLSELPEGSVAKILEALRVLGSPSNVVWVPEWRFGSEEERLRADQALDRILSQQRRTDLVIYTRDLITFRGCWQENRANGQAQDWFTTLNVS
jgi:hypothetical protein